MHAPPTDPHRPPLYRQHLGWLGLMLALIALPLLVLLGAGLIWLWQTDGFWIWWGVTIALLTVAAAIYQFALRRPAPAPIRMQPPGVGSSPAETSARQALAALAEQVTAADVQDAEAVQQLLQRIVHTVAQAHAPHDAAALWRFTLPEALLMAEDLAARVRAVIRRDVPILCQVELTWLVRALNVVEPMQRLSALMRVTAWFNPASAVRSQLTSQLTGQIKQVVSERVLAQVAAILVEEIGTAAIKLYAGDYRRRASELLPTAPQPLPATPPEPLTVLLAGQRNVGKSSLLNAWLGITREPVGVTTATPNDCRAYELTTDAIGPLILVDSPGLTHDQLNGMWLKQAADCDLVLWLVAADRADRALDEQALAQLRALTNQDVRLRAIPIIVVITHADRLDPPLEWSPPYDVEQGQRLKEQQFRAARQAIAEQLRLPESRCVLIALPSDAPAWNLDALNAALVASLPEAQHKQLERSQRRDGWFKRIRDGAISVQNTAEKLGKLATDSAKLNRSG